MPVPRRNQPHADKRCRGPAGRPEPGVREPRTGAAGGRCPPAVRERVEPRGAECVAVSFQPRSTAPSTAPHPSNFREATHVLPLLRLLKTLAGPIGPHRQEPSCPCVTHWRVWPNDLDAFGHMNNGRYQVIMDLGRIDFLRRCHLLRGVVRNRWAVPVGEAHMAYRKPLRPLQRYTLHTRLLHWDARWFYFRQEFFGAADAQRPVATGHVKTLFVGRTGAVPTTTVVRELAGRELAVPALPAEARALFRVAAVGEAGEVGEVAEAARA